MFPITTIVPKLIREGMLENYRTLYPDTDPILTPENLLKFLMEYLNNKRPTVLTIKDQKLYNASLSTVIKEKQIASDVEKLPEKQFIYPNMQLPNKSLLSILPPREAQKTFTPKDIFMISQKTKVQTKNTYMVSSPCQIGILKLYETNAYKESSKHVSEKLKSVTHFTTENLYIDSHMLIDNDTETQYLFYIDKEKHPCELIELDFLTTGSEKMMVESKESIDDFFIFEQKLKGKRVPMLCVIGVNIWIGSIEPSKDLNLCCTLKPLGPNNYNSGEYKKPFELKKAHVRYGHTICMLHNNTLTEMTFPCPIYNEEEYIKIKDYPYTVSNDNLPEDGYLFYMGSSLYYMGGVIDMNVPKITKEKVICDRVYQLNILPQGFNSTIKYPDFNYGIIVSACVPREISTETPIIVSTQNATHCLLFKDDGMSIFPVLSNTRVPIPKYYTNNEESFQILINRTLNDQKKWVCQYVDMCFEEKKNLTDDEIYQYGKNQIVENEKMYKESLAYLRAYEISRVFYQASIKNYKVRMEKIALLCYHRGQKSLALYYLFKIYLFNYESNTFFFQLPIEDNKIESLLKFLNEKYPNFLFTQQDLNIIKIEGVIKWYNSYTGTIFQGSPFYSNIFKVSSSEFTKYEEEYRKDEIFVLGSGKYATVGDNFPTLIENEKKVLRDIEKSRNAEIAEIERGKKKYEEKIILEKAEIEKLSLAAQIKKVELPKKGEPPKKVVPETEGVKLDIPSDEFNTLYKDAEKSVEKKVEADLEKLREALKSKFTITGKKSKPGLKSKREKVEKWFKEIKKAPDSLLRLIFIYGKYKFVKVEDILTLSKEEKTTIAKKPFRLTPFEYDLIIKGMNEKYRDKLARKRKDRPRDEPKVKEESKEEKIEPKKTKPEVKKEPKKEKPKKKVVDDDDKGKFLYDKDGNYEVLPGLFKVLKDLGEVPEDTPDNKIERLGFAGFVDGLSKEQQMILFLHSKKAYYIAKFDNDALLKDVKIRSGGYSDVYLHEAFEDKSMNPIDLPYNLFRKEYDYLETKIYNALNENEEAGEKMYHAVLEKYFPEYYKLIMSDWVFFKNMIDVDTPIVSCFRQGFKAFIDKISKDIKRFRLYKFQCKDLLTQLLKDQEDVANEESDESKYIHDNIEEIKKLHRRFRLSSYEYEHFTSNYQEPSNYKTHQFPKDEEEEEEEEKMDVEKDLPSKPETPPHGEEPSRTFHVDIKGLLDALLDTELVPNTNKVIRRRFSNFINNKLTTKIGEGDLIQLGYWIASFDDKRRLKNEIFLKFYNKCKFDFKAYLLELQADKDLIYDFVPIIVSNDELEEYRLIIKERRFPLIVHNEQIYRDVFNEYGQLCNDKNWIETEEGVYRKSFPEFLEESKYKDDLISAYYFNGEAKSDNVIKSLIGTDDIFKTTQFLFTKVEYSAIAHRFDESIPDLLAQSKGGEKVKIPRGKRKIEPEKEETKKQRELSETKLYIVFADTTVTVTYKYDKTSKEDRVVRGVTIIGEKDAKEKNKYIPDLDISYVVFWERMVTEITNGGIMYDPFIYPFNLAIKEIYKKMDVLGLNLTANNVPLYKDCFEVLQLYLGLSPTSDLVLKKSINDKVEMLTAKIREIIGKAFEMGAEYLKSYVGRHVEPISYDSEYEKILKGLKGLPIDDKDDPNKYKDLGHVEFTFKEN